MLHIITKHESRYHGLPQFLRYIEAAPDGEYELTTKKRRKTRTSLQNNYLWGVVYTTLLRGLQDAGWEVTNTEQVHEYFKSHFATEQVINKHTGEVITIPSSTTEMDTVTFTAYLDQLKDYAIEYLNIEIPEPEQII